MNRDTDICVPDTLPDNSKTDAILLQRVSEGDVSAFERLYYRWGKRVYWFMLKMIRSVSDAEDITQETFARLWNMRADIDTGRSIQSLIFIIVRRIAVDKYRHSCKMTATSSDKQKEKVSQEMSPQEILEERETKLLIETAIERMPEKQREVFTLYYYQHLSAKDISLQLGLSYDNVRKHIYNGKRQLRDIISLLIMFFFK